MQPKLSIRIPVYNQINLLIECLNSLQIQTFKQFSIILIDDCSMTDYKSVINKFPELNIEYIRNEKNLGALQNMLNSLYLESNEEYIMVMHEDDILHHTFLQNSLNLLEKSHDIAFSISTLSFFSDINSTNFEIIKQTNSIFCKNKNEFIYNILKGNAVGFGSVIYRKSKLKNVKFDFETYAEVGDRPFLSEICNNSGCIIIPDNSYFARLPIGKDARWKKLNYRHLINLYLYYKKNLPKNLNKTDIKHIKISFTHSFLENYINLSKQNVFIFFKTMLILRSNKIISIKYLLLSFRLIRKFVEKIKPKSI